MKDETSKDRHLMFVRKIDYEEASRQAMCSRKRLKERELGAGHMIVIAS
jgi:hypothetical protein